MLYRLILEGSRDLRTSELNDGRYLDVRAFAHAVRRGADWERRNSEGRQTEIVYVLRTARKVVHRNCALDIITKGVGYSTSETIPSLSQISRAVPFPTAGQ